MKKAVKSCEGCPALCCKYIAVEFDAPTDKEDFHHVRWFLMHENVKVQIDDEGKWYVEFGTRCKNLNDKNLCNIHELAPKENQVKYGEPQICVEHSPEDCEFHGSGAMPYEQIFADHLSFEKYVEENLPSIINKKESDKEEMPLIKLSEEGIDELISKLEKLKENKEFEIRDSDDDGYAFELKE